MKKTNVRSKLILALAVTILMMPVAKAETSASSSSQAVSGEQSMPEMQECTCEGCTTTEPHMCMCSNTSADNQQREGQQDTSTPPEKPDDDKQGDKTPPENSDGQQNNMPVCSCQGGSGSASGSRPDKPSGEKPDGKGGPGSSDNASNGTSVTTISDDADISGETYQSSGDDENALRIDGATVTLDGITVEKSGGESSNTETGDFYGQNAAVLAQNGAVVTITDATITTDAQNGNGVFSYGEGTVVNISDSVITTSQNNSGGIQTTGGGTTNASNLTITTDGNSAAAIRSDRGGGTVNVDGGTYTTNGTGSPAVYSTADITVSNATLTANDSEAAVVEGKSSIVLNDCEISGNMTGTYKDDYNENIHNVMIYQSMSGDSEEGNAVFSVTGGSLTALAGDMIYVTNTDCTITLSDVELTLANGKLLTVEGNSSSRGWGTAGANGADVVFTADSQELTGDITVDTISTLDLTLANGTYFSGSINIVENTEGGEAVDNNAVVTVEEGCTWSLTGNSTVTSLENAGTIEYNGYTITLADGSVLSK